MYMLFQFSPLILYSFVCVFVFRFHTRLHLTSNLWTQCLTFDMAHLRPGRLEPISVPRQYMCY